MPEELIKKYVPIDKQKQAYIDLKNNVPVQYIIGHVDFYGYTIKVNKNVLIPRFETEYLVEKLINYINKYLNKKIAIADLGTGSGAIAIALNKELNADVTAFDISKKALKVAKENAENNGSSVQFLLHDIKKEIPGVYDCIVSNPPYIAYENKADDIVHNNEPHLALYADKKGLDFYEKILGYAKNVLSKKSIIAFEIGMDQANDIKKIAEKYFESAIIKIEKDLPGKDRYIFIINE